MYAGTLPEVSNREDWIQSFEIRDDVDALVDLTGASIVFEVRDQAERGRTRLSATTDNGKLIVLSLGVAQFSFTRDEMKQLCEGSYDFGCTVTVAGVTSQLIIGEVPIVDGVVS